MLLGCLGRGRLWLWMRVRMGGMRVTGSGRVMLSREGSLSIACSSLGRVLMLGCALWGPSSWTSRHAEAWVRDACCGVDSLPGGGPLRVVPLAAGCHVRRVSRTPVRGERRNAAGRSRCGIGSTDGGSCPRIVTLTCVRELGSGVGRQGRVGLSVCDWRVPGGDGPQAR